MLGSRARFNGWKLKEINSAAFGRNPMGSGMGRGLMAQVQLKVEEGFLVGHIWGIDNVHQLQYLIYKLKGLVCSSCI